MTVADPWLIAGAIGGVALVVFSPPIYKVTDSVTGGNGYVAETDGWYKARPTLLGYFVHCVVLFLAAFLILEYGSWDCE